LAKIFASVFPVFFRKAGNTLVCRGFCRLLSAKETQGLKGGSTPEKRGRDRLWGFSSFMACKAFSGIYREDYYRIALNFSKRLSDVLYRQKTDCGKNMRETRL